MARSGESDTERLRLLSGSVELIRQHPVLGAGPGQFGLHYSATRAAHPHNTPMQLLSEYGLVAGTAGVLLGCLAVMFALRRLRLPANIDPVNASLTAALLMGLTDSVFSGNLTMPHSQVLCATLIAWLFARGALPPASPGLRVLAVSRTALMAIGLAATAATLVLSLEYLHVIRDMPYPPQLRIPSFWQYGRFSAW
jgi:hypothetical protein